MHSGRAALSAKQTLEFGAAKVRNADEAGIYIVRLVPDQLA